MLKIEKKLIKISVILFLTLFKFSYLNADSKSEKLFNHDVCNKDTFIKRQNVENLDFLPKDIIINFSNSRQWYQNFFELRRVLGNKKYKHTKKIPLKYKKFFFVNLNVKFNNGTECIFKGKARIHGGRGDHISNYDFISSLRVNILNGNINNISEFILFLPQTRGGNNEILTTVLLEKMNIMAPFTMNTNVKINNSDFHTYLFQEKINSNFLKRNKKPNGVIMSLNKSYQIEKVVKDFDQYFDKLSIVANDENIDNYDYINAVDNLNYLLIENYNLNFYNNSLNSVFFDNNFNNIEVGIKNKKRINFEKFSIFQAFLISVGASHSLKGQDTKYYSNNFYNILEPVYYDGMPRILGGEYNLKDNAAKKVIPYFTNKTPEYVKEGSNTLIQQLKAIDYEKLKKDLNVRNFNISNDKLKSTIDNIIFNLQTIKSSKKIDLTDKNINLNKYKFFDKINNKESVKLAFGGYFNLIEYCDINLEICNIRKITSENLKSLLSKHILKLDGKNLFYVRKSKKDFIESRIPQKYGLETFETYRIDSHQNIYFKDNATIINVDKNNKIIDIKVYSSDERIIFIVDNFDGWRINYSNKNLITKLFKKSQIKGIFPSGCLNFIDSNIKKLTITVSNADCPDALHFFRSKGSILDLNIQNSSFDALDTDFSDLTINKILVNKASQECIGLKSGYYTLKKIDLKNCLDKAISAGELSVVSVNDAKIEKSTIGVYAKDSSKINIINYDFKDVKNCIGSVRGDKKYLGSTVNIKNLKNKCNVKNYITDNISKISIDKNVF